jgi:peptidoglycan/LPS O-acetylase OafA/YrhL
MCYSIYLLHLMVMAAISKALSSFSRQPDHGALVLYIIVLLGGVLFVSAIFYKLVEQPCMRRDWLRNLLRRTKTK